MDSGEVPRVWHQRLVLARIAGTELMVVSPGSPRTSRWRIRMWTTFGPCPMPDIQDDATFGSTHLLPPQAEAPLEEGQRLASVESARRNIVESAPFNAKPSQAIAPKLLHGTVTLREHGVAQTVPLGVDLPPAPLGGMANDGIQQDRLYDKSKGGFLLDEPIAHRRVGNCDGSRVHGDSGQRGPCEGPLGTDLEA